MRHVIQRDVLARLLWWGWDGLRWTWRLVSMVLTTVLTIFGTFAVVRDWYLCTTPMPDEHAVILGAFCAGYAHTWIPIIVLLSLLTLLMRFALYSSPDRQETGRQAVPGTRKEEECNRDNGGNASLEGW